MTSIKSLNNVPFFSEASNEILQAPPPSFPLDIWRHIFTFLSPWDLCNLKLTCKQWKRIASDDQIWKRLFEKNFKSWTLLENINEGNWAKLYLDAQRFYCEPENLQMKEIRTFEGEVDYSYKQGSWLITAFEQNCKIWNLECGRPITNFYFNKGDYPIISEGKLFLKIKEGILITDIKKMVTISNGEGVVDGAILKTSFAAHRMIMERSFLSFTNNKDSIKVLDLERQQEIFNIQHDTSLNISRLKIENNVLSYFLIGSKTEQFIIIDIAKKCFIKEINIKDLMLDRNVWAFKYDIFIQEIDKENIELFNIKTGKKFKIKKNEGFEKEIDEHKYIELIDYNKNYLIVVEFTGFAKIWDIKDGKPKGGLQPKEHIGHIEKIILQDNTLIAASFIDKNILSWNATTMRYERTHATENIITIWNLSTMKQVLKYSLPTRFRHMYLVDDQLVVHLKDRVTIFLITKMQ